MWIGLRWLSVGPMTDLVNVARMLVLLMTRGLEHVGNHCEVCASVTHWWAEAAVCLCARSRMKLEVTSVSSWGSEWEIEQGFPLMTQKTNSRPLSGIAHPLHIQRKPGKPSRTSRKCWFICFDCDGPVHYEFILPGQLVNQHTTWRFCNDWRSKSTENIWNDGGTWTGCFTLSVCWHTLLYQCRNFWLLTTWVWSSTHVTPLIWLLVISSSFWDWSHSYKIMVFSIPLKFRNSCWPSYLCFQEVISSSTSSVAETGSIA